MSWGYFSSTIPSKEPVPVTFRNLLGSFSEPSKTMMAEHESFDLQRQLCCTSSWLDERKNLSILGKRLEK